MTLSFKQWQKGFCSLILVFLLAACSTAELPNEITQTEPAEQPINIHGSIWLGTLTAIAAEKPSVDVSFEFLVEDELVKGLFLMATVKVDDPLDVTFEGSLKGRTLSLLYESSEYNESASLTGSFSELGSFFKGTFILAVSDKEKEYWEINLNKIAQLRGNQPY